MSGGKVSSGLTMNILLQNEKLSSSSEVFESLWMPTSSSSFHGSQSMVNFENVHGGDTTNRSFLHGFEKEDNGEGDHEYDACFHQPGKKRRLSVDQVQFLEKNFEVENKLEPDRKIQLAKELGLQPRQIAIWFQNRRARYKTKQLEKDYTDLKSRYEGLQSDYDCLVKENEKLSSELDLLKERLLPRDKERANSQPCDPNDSPRTEPEKPNLTTQLEKVSDVTRLCKHEDASSTKSDVYDSDSSHCKNHSSFLEPADSSRVFGQEHSDFSQDEEDNLISKSLLQQPLCFPKLEDCYYHEQPANSCNLGYPVDDQPFWFSSYD